MEAMYLPLGLLGLALFALPVGYFFWLYRVSRPLKAGQAVVPAYEPPAGISPLEAGYLLDNSLMPRTAAAAILDLVLRGTIEIIEVGGVVEGLRLTPGSMDAGLSPFDKLLLVALFGGGIAATPKEAAARFQAAGGRLREAAARQLKEKGFIGKADYVPPIIFGASVVASVIFLVGLFDVLGAFGAVSLWAVCILLAQLGYIAATLRPPLTKRGRQAVADLLGFKMYLTAAEGARIRWEEIEEAKVNRFTPYAVVFNASVTWSTKLQSLTSALLAEMA